MTPKELAVMQQALEALAQARSNAFYGKDWEVVDESITALREALTEPVKLAISEKAFNWIDANAPMFVREALADEAEQEPVGYVQYFGNKLCFRESAKNGWHPVFLNADPVRTKNLTDEEIATLVQRHTIDEKIMPFALCEAVIAKFKEKNK